MSPSSNRLTTSPAKWFADLIARPGVNLVDLTPDILIEAVFLPGEPPTDPADRMIAATARKQGLTLVTRDRRLRACAESGQVSPISC